jgi:hypothetical protein
MPAFGSCAEILGEVKMQEPRRPQRLRGDRKENTKRYLNILFKIYRIPDRNIGELCAYAVKKSFLLLLFERTRRMPTFRSCAKILGEVEMRNRGDRKGCAEIQRKHEEIFKHTF